MKQDLKLRGGKDEDFCISIATNMQGHLPIPLLNPAWSHGDRMRLVPRVLDLKRRFDSGLSALRNSRHQKPRPTNVTGR